MMNNRRSTITALVFSGLLSAGLGHSTSAMADTITFDDVDASSGDVSIDGINPYHGYTWTNFYITTTTPGFPGFNNGIVSGPNAAYSGGETSSGGVVSPVVGSVRSTTGLFNFVSAYLGAGYYDNLSLQVTGSRNGTVLFSDNVLLNTEGAQRVNFNFTGIDTLSFVTSTSNATTDPYQCGSFNCTQFTVDNFSVTPASPVPLPAAFMLLLGGLGALSPLAGWRRDC